ncbi:MAG: cytochrome b561 domain-containing protein [Pseudomonadota bacterium]
MDWLFGAIDPSRAHVVDGLVAWHGRLMVLAWAVLFPVGILVARFFKIMPGQDWPRHLDNQAWWRGHLVLQYTGGCALALGIVLILVHPGSASWLHSILGWIVIGLAALQFLAGWLRGSKGGPTAPTLAGDHYDMSVRRRVFEHFHKSTGYLVLALSVAAIVSGLWLANAPIWMWLGIGAWWLVLGIAFVLLQRRGMAHDTYQAIWGPDRRHPGNAMDPIGWGVRRRDTEPHAGE